MAMWGKSGVEKSAAAQKCDGDLAEILGAGRKRKGKPGVAWDVGDFREFGESDGGHVGNSGTR